MRRILLLLAVALLLAGAAFAQRADRSNTVTSFDGQYLYYNNNSGLVARMPVTPLLFASAPTGPCLGTEFAINQANSTVSYCNAGTWAVIAGGAGGSSIFSSFQVGSNMPIIGTGNYLQLTGSLPLVIGSQSGTGTSGNPYVIPFTCPTCGTGTVTSAGLTVNGASSSGIFAVTGSPVTLSGALNYNLSGSSGGVPYFSSGTVLSSSGALASGNFVLGGGAGSAPTAGFSTVPINKGGTNAVTQSAAAISLLPTPTRAGDVVYWDGSIWNHLSGNNSGTLVLSENASGVPSWLSASGSGTVTSAGLTVNGGSSSGIFAVTGSPVTTSGSLNYNLSGTSGGVPYFSSSTVLSSSGVLLSGQFLLGGGAGNPPTGGFSTVPVARGGTNMTSGTSGGVLCFTDTGIIASSGLLSALSLVVGGGAGACPTTLNLPTAQDVPYLLSSTPSGGVGQAPAWSLPGTPLVADPGASFTINNSFRESMITASNAGAIAISYNPTLVSNFTAAVCNIGAGLATVTPSSGTFNGSGTGIIPGNWCGYMYNDNTNVVAGVFPSIAAFPNCLDSGGNHLNFTASTGSISCGTSGGGGGSSAFPITVSGTVTSGGVPYFSSTTVESSSALLTQYGVLFGGGAGAAPTASAQGAANMPLIGQGAANPIFSTIAYPTSLTSGGALYASSTTAISGGGILNTGFLTKGGGAGAAPTNSLCDEGATTTNVLTCTDTAGAKFVSVATGTSPPATTAGTAGAYTGAEGTAFTNVSGAAGLYFDSSAHEILAKTNGASSGGMLIRSQPGAIHQTAKTAAISTATLCDTVAGACNTAGDYHVHFSFIETGTACGTPATGGVTFLLTWTDSNGTAHSAVSLGMDDASAINAVSQTFHFQTSLGAAWASGDFNIATNGSIIQYATGYTACGVGTGAYQLDATVTRAGQ